MRRVRKISIKKMRRRIRRRPIFLRVRDLGSGAPSPSLSAGPLPQRGRLERRARTDVLRHTRHVTWRTARGAMAELVVGTWIQVYRKQQRRNSAMHTMLHSHSDAV